MKEIKPIAFYHFPKSGGTFLNSYFKDVMPDYVECYGHAPVERTYPQCLHQYRFTVTRNELEWYVSRYHHFAQIAKNKSKGVMRGHDAGLWGKAFTERFPTVMDHIIWSGQNGFTFWNLLYNMCYMDTGEGMERIVTIVRGIQKIDNALVTICKEAKVPLPEIMPREYAKVCPAKTFNKSKHETAWSYV